MSGCSTVAGLSRSAEPERALIGRVDELALIDATIRSRQHAVVVVTGIAGVGKSALARAALAVAANDRPTAWIAATPSLGSVPFGAVASLLPPGSTPPPTADAAQWAAHTLLTQLAGTVRPCVAIDDAHLLDPLSASVVANLADHDDVVTVLTVRSGESLSEVLQALVTAEHVVRLELQPLARSESRALATQVLGGTVDDETVGRLWDATGGNPLFLKELVSTGRDRGEITSHGDHWTWSGRWTTSERIIDLVHERVRGATHAERELLEALTLFEPLDADIAVALVGSSGLQRATERATVRLDEHGNVRLAHPLYGEVLAARLEPEGRAELSSRLAELLDAQGSDQSIDALRVATLRLDAGAAVDPEVLSRASRLAITFCDQRLAERLARAAADAGAGPAAFVHLAEALYWQGRFEESLSVNAALNLSNVSDDLRAQAVCCQASALLWGLDQVDAAVDLLVRAERDLHDGSARAEVQAHHASVIHMAGDESGAQVLAEAVIDDPASGDRARARALGPAIQAQALCGHPERAVARAVEASGLAISLVEELPTASGGILIGQCLALLVAGRAHELEQLTQLLLDVSLARSDDDFRGIRFFLRGRAALLRGRPRTALARCTEAIALLRDHDVGRVLPWCLGVTAQAAGQVGDALLAQQTSDEAMRSTGALRVWASELGLGAAWAAHAAGERSRAREIALDAAVEARERGQYGSEILVLTELIRFGGASQASARLETLAPDCEGPLAMLAARHARAVDGRDGIELAAVGEELAELGIELLAAEASSAAAGALRAAGLHARAADAERRAEGLARQCEGAVTLGEQHSITAPLTEREREVAALAARGLSRREVAERLFLSERTVGNHLHRVYTKLGVSSAAALRPLFRAGEETAPD